MHHIAICEDNYIDYALLQNILDDYELAMHDSLNVKHFPDAEAMLAYFSLNDYRPEVLLMDISLPGISGIEAVRRLRSDNFSGEVIFTTHSREYALSAFEVNARQYLVKPVDKQKLFTVLEDVLHSRRNYLFIRSQRTLRRVKFRDILYCETQGKYQVIHTRSEEIRVRITSHGIRELAPTPLIFTAFGAAYLVNIENIDSLVDGKVIFDGGKVLMLSRKKFHELKHTVTNHYHT